MDGHPNVHTQSHWYYSVAMSGEQCLFHWSILVIEWLKLSGSRHLAKYCADSSYECSLTFSISASTCR